MCNCNFFFVIELMIEMGYDRQEVENSLQTRAYDDSFATYLLLGAKASDVSTP